MAKKESADEILEVQNKFQKLNHYIQYVNQRMDSLMGDIWARDDKQVEEIGRRLKRAQEQIKEAYGFAKNMFHGGDPDGLMGTWSSGAAVGIFKFILERLETEEDYINNVVNCIICEFDAEDDDDLGEEKKDRESGVGSFCFQPLRVKSSCKEEYILGRGTNGYDQEFLASNAGIFKGVNVKELLQETLELIVERDQILDGGPILLLRKLKDCLKDEEDGRGQWLAETLVIRGWEVENWLCYILVFLVLFVMGNERHRDAFQQFQSRLKARSDKKTGSINKFTNLLEGADIKLKEMKNLTKMTANILEKYCSARIEERQVVRFLEILLDQMEHLDFILQDVGDELSESEDVVQRCEETMDLIWAEMTVFDDLFFRWEHEVSMLIGTICFLPFQ